MNYGTGSGTLIHEVVHAYLRENLGACPVWFNEGLASLYECSSFEGGEIHGRPNRRLPRLQEAIRTKAALPLARRVALPDAEFYGEGQDLHYAEARYLLYHLQERGKLERLYRALRDRDPVRDSTGAGALGEAIGESLGSLEA